MYILNIYNNILSLDVITIPIGYLLYDILIMNRQQTILYMYKTLK